MRRKGIELEWPMRTGGSVKVVRIVERRSSTAAVRVSLSDIPWEAPWPESETAYAGNPLEAK